jgi:hypothetical protein
MRNIAIVVEGFKGAIERNEALEFLEYERVEECATANVISQMRHDLVIVLNTAKKLNEEQLSQINSTDKPSTYHNAHTHRLQAELSHKIHSILGLLPEVPCPLPLQWCAPSLIIIASLLEKVHNFGYILRTLHQTRSLLLVPSQQPLQHPECLEFVPPNSQVEVVEIKPEEIYDFVKLMKTKGYPLIGLEQCSGSLKI